MTADELTRRLYDAADDYQAAVLDELRDKARITWTCPVRPWTNQVGEPCDDCGRTEAEATAAAECGCGHPTHTGLCTGTGATLDPMYGRPADEACACVR